MKKVLVEVFSIYAEGFEEPSIMETEVMDDTSENRKQMVKNQVRYGHELKLTDDIKAFISGKTNKIYVEYDSTEWEAPVGHTIILSTFDKKMNELDTDYQEKINKIEKLFNQSRQVPKLYGVFKNDVHHVKENGSDDVTMLKIKELSSVHTSESNASKHCDKLNDINDGWYTYELLEVNERTDAERRGGIK